MTPTPNIHYLTLCESEAIFVLRELAAEFERPSLLFSGGKDSIVISHLARKTFFPGPNPFPWLPVGTGLRESVSDTATTRASECGMRADDQRSAAAMEDGKRNGYF